MTQSKMTLWQAIDALVNQIPFSKPKVESTLGAQLSEVRRNPYTVFLQNERTVVLAGGERINKIDLRLGTEEGDPGFLALDIDGDCIGIEAVRSHYGEVKITDVPRGRSLDEATTHSTVLPWGKLSFGFKERNPDCLAYVVLNPKKAE